MAADRYPEFDSNFFSKYTTLDHYLNKGAFGIVFGPIPWHDIQVAIKLVMLAQGKATDDFKNGMEAKQQIWTSLYHKNIMRIHSVDLARLPIAMFIVMEYAAGGSVAETLQSLGYGNKLPIRIVTNWAKQIAEGMLYLHAKDIVHRDLKSSNILLMETYNACNTDAMVTLKIADFDDIKEHDHTMTMSFKGTTAYMAPEVLTQERFSKASDVWSFGVVIWEMISGDIPYNNLDSATIFNKASKGEPNKLIIESFPEDCQLLLNGCWKLKSKERLSIHEILSALQDIGTKIYKSDPVLIEIIRTKAVNEGNELVSGLAILDKELFVVSGSSSQIEVYDSIKLSFNRRFKMKELHNLEELGLHNPLAIASCSRNKCLYVIDRTTDWKSNEILRVDPDGKIIKRWSTGDDYHDGWSLSVTDEASVILTFQRKNTGKLIEYSPDGELFREINLSDVGIHSPWHAIKLTNGHFVVSHGFGYLDPHKVIIVDADGKLMKSFGGKSGSDIGQMNQPVYLSVDGCGFVFVADQENHRVLLLDSNLKFKREILTDGKHELRYPRRILLDESTNRVFVTDWSYGLIKIFQF